jgi:hypothetical protein
MILSRGGNGFSELGRCSKSVEKPAEITNTSERNYYDAGS